MTDEQILVELARRVMGWERDSECYWDPFTDWNDAMGLAEKWAVGEGGDWYDIEWLPQIGYHVYLFPPNQMDGTDFTSAIHKSGPRAVCMAVAKAAGIEVES